MPDPQVLRRRRLLSALIAALLPTGCAQGVGSPGADGSGSGGGIGAFLARLFRRAAPPPPPPVRYVLGSGYPAGGVWYYPRESFTYDMTGIAEVIDAHDPLTTDGELFDPSAMAAAHQTLQLPAVVRVTNLANGRQALLRLNDRGPASPARVLGVTPRVAALLGFDADGTARVRVQVESGPSQALVHQLNGTGSRIDVATAPVGAVQIAALPPPPGARGTSGRLAAAPAAPAAEAEEAQVPLRQPETVLQGTPEPGTLWIEAGSFGRPDYAMRRAAQLADTGARAGSMRSAGQTSYTVRIGPIESVARADSLMQQVVRDGVTDARVVVE